MTLNDWLTAGWLRLHHASRDEIEDFESRVDISEVEAEAMLDLAKEVQQLVTEKLRGSLRNG